MVLGGIKILFVNCSDFWFWWLVMQGAVGFMSDGFSKWKRLDGNFVSKYRNFVSDR